MNYTTPQLQLHYTTTTTTAALHHTTFSSCGWGDWSGDHCTIVTTPKNTTPTTFQSISGFALHPTTNFSYRFPIFETSATALCGNAGIYGPKARTWPNPSDKISAPNAMEISPMIGALGKFLRSCATVQDCPSIYIYNIPLLIRKSLWNERSMAPKVF